ncbi:hypothetical protein LWP59_14690 [Amycolatopsis acidiphila]|uniref:hypothetical protein n=1 Tax=Amycolatopsis acidiphila TaxID=715473 RepID=UPI001643E46E|nr:hypothetical protein [Amycolatopsis acidiphila]UIJ62781.1 hypothetical protein LWP59_14690 [Amycolatopsis acidiphila]
MTEEDARPPVPPVPPVRPDPDLVWQVEGDEPTIEQYRAESSRAAERSRQEDEE